MDSVLADIENVLCYIDDMVIMSNSFSDILNSLTCVLQRLQDWVFFIKLSKTELLRENVTLLGHVISLKGIRPNPKKVQAVQRARPPANKGEMKSFLGLVSYLRRFVPNYSEIVAPLVQLTKKNQPFVFSAECQSAFETIRDRVREHVLLEAPRGDGRFVLLCDASDTGIGAVLMQLQDEELAILEFASKSLTKAERNWPTYEQEAFAIRWAVVKFEDYVKTGRVLVYTDHKSLEWMFKAQIGKVCQ